MTSPFEPLNTGTSSAGFLPSWERRLWNKAKIGISRYEVDIVPVSQGGVTSYACGEANEAKSFDHEAS